ncbi:unnamed protein product [Brassica oleracea var. botrytis]|uniref:Uncharacterized protein n=3 Tax=Brassica TaxID=3705 RepID=A0A0D3BZK7_BRAOL|nr:hypothetical protein Bca52824_047106 [Brassica carinata]VDD11284.1 unnamed protein product [Brassica oleracea]
MYDDLSSVINDLVQWDSSPNRKLIHEIIDAFEDSLAMKKRKKDRRKQWSKSSIQGCVE